MVLFPEPEGPTIAVVSPAFIWKETLLNVLFKFSLAVGYLKTRSLKYIAFFNSKEETLSDESLISGSLSRTSNICFPTTFALEIAYILGFNYMIISIPVINASNVVKIVPAVYGSPLVFTLPSRIIYVPIQNEYT